MHTTFSHTQNHNTNLSLLEATHLMAMPQDSCSLCPFILKDYNNPLLIQLVFLKVSSYDQFIMWKSREMPGLCWFAAAPRACQARHMKLHLLSHEFVVHAEKKKHQTFGRECVQLAQCTLADLGNQQGWASPAMQLIGCKTGLSSISSSNNVIAHYYHNNVIWTHITLLLVPELWHVHFLLSSEFPCCVLIAVVTSQFVFQKFVPRWPW